MNKPELGFIYRWELAEIKTNKAILLLHGTGGTEHDLIDLGRLIGPRYNLLAPKGKVSEDGKARFFRRKAIGIFDVEDLKHMAIQLTDFIRKAKMAFGLEEIIAVGYSNGANMATGIIFQEPDLLAGAILLRPMVPYEPEPMDLSSMKILMISGMLDNTMNNEEPERLEQIFKINKAQATIKHLSVSHGLTTDDIRISKEWIKNNF